MRQQFLTKTQEPVVLTQGEKPQPQVLTQEQENPICDESTLRISSQAKKTTYKMRNAEWVWNIPSSFQKQEHQLNTQLKRHLHMHTKWCNSRHEKSYRSSMLHSTWWLIAYKEASRSLETKAEAALSEMKQLHDQQCFKPINIKDVTTSENHKAIESLLLLVEKKRQKNKQGAALMANHNDNGLTGKMYHVLLSAQNRHLSHQ